VSAAVEAMALLNSERVDIVCIGSGSAGLAAAIAAADAGLSVFVAEPRRRRPHSGPLNDPVESWTSLLQRHWSAEEFDEPTAAYLHELTCDVSPPRRSRTHGQLPIGFVESFDEHAVVGRPRTTVPPFYGGEVAHWARECLTSPYGVVFSRVAPLTMSLMRLEDGTTIRASVVGQIPSVRRSGMTLRQWLRDMAKERGVEIHGSSTIARLLFSDGQPVGAVLETPDGIRHVRARQGVLLGTGSPTADDLLAVHPASVLHDGRLSLVSRNASRFARLELLTSAANMSACAPQGRLA
jgi:hypothetical protein